MFEVLLPDQTRVLGADHRDTLWTNNDYRVINISHIGSSRRHNARSPTPPISPRVSFR